MKSYFRKYEVQRKLFSQDQSPESSDQEDSTQNPTPEKELFESDFAFLTFHQVEKIMELVWKGFADSNDYRQILEETLAASIEKNVRKIVFNAKSLQAITTENQEWTIESWFPTVQSKGIEIFAFVLPDDIFGEVSLQMIADKTKEKYNINSKFFSTNEEALEWIKSV